MNFEAMKVDTDVLAHIQALNDETRARAEREGWTFFTTLAEETASEYKTVYEFERSMWIQSYSDSYKEEYGVRPRHINFETTTLEEIVELLEDI